MPEFNAMQACGTVFSPTDSAASFESCGKRPSAAALGQAQMCMEEKRDQLRVYEL
jgi:hypothetical protein